MTHKPKTRQQQPTRTAETRGRMVEASSGDAPTHKLTPLQTAEARIQVNGQRVNLPNQASDENVNLPTVGSRHAPPGAKR